MTAHKTGYGYWGTNSDQLEYSDGRQVRVGTTHKVKAKEKPNVCHNGMHACFKASDIPTHKHEYVTKIYLVMIQGDLTNKRRRRSVWEGKTLYTSYSDKFAGRERTYLGVVTGRDLPEKYVKYVGNGIYHFKFHKEGFDEAVRKAFIEKYPELKREVEATLTRPDWVK